MPFQSSPARYSTQQPIYSMKMFKPKKKQHSDGCDSSDDDGQKKKNQFQIDMVSG